MALREQSRDGERSVGSLGQKLRQRRKELGLTLSDVASRAGFSNGFISQIERGITIPSLTSLIAVCAILEMKVSDFLSSQAPQQPFTRHNDRITFGLGGQQKTSVVYERLSAAFPGNLLRSVIMHEPPGYQSERFSHDGEEIFYIISGSLTLEIDGVSTVLEQGDSAHFSSNRVHATWNHTDQTTLVLHTCTVDVFGDVYPDTPAQDSVEGAVAINRAAKRKRYARKPFNQEGTAS
jgi:transcriptional regulator with XRE-family HTH domain